MSPPVLEVAEEERGWGYGEVWIGVRWVGLAHACVGTQHLAKSVFYSNCCLTVLFGRFFFWIKLSF